MEPNVRGREKAAVRVEDTAAKSAILEEASLLRHNDATAEVDERSVKAVVFRLGASYLAFPGCDVKEILPAGDIAWVPGTPDFLPGIINVRGDIESVVDIRGFLGIPLDEAQYPFILLVSTEGLRSGVLVEEVLDVADVAAGSIDAPLATLAENVKAYVAGEFAYGSRTVTFLNAGALLSAMIL